MKTPRPATLAPARLAAALIVLLASAASAQTYVEPQHDSAGWAKETTSCTACHKSADLVGAKTHGGAKICTSPARWIPGTPGYCCGGATATHCPNDGFTNYYNKMPADATYVAPKFYKPLDEKYIQAWISTGTTKTPPTPVVTKPKPNPVVTKPKPKPVVAYWCDPATGTTTAVPPGKAAKGAVKLPKKDSPCTKTSSVATSTMTTPGTSTGTVVSAVSLPLIDPVETRWLTKVQAGAYADARTAAKDDAARTSLDDKNRALVKAQIRPEAASAYGAAYTPPPADPVKIKAAIGGIEMWGGTVKDVVGLYQVKTASANPKMLEIQLSEEDWVALNTPKGTAPTVDPKTKGKKGKTPPVATPTSSIPVTDAAKAYELARRGGANGQAGPTTTFKESVYDPIVLHQSVVTALTALGKAPKQPDAVNPNGGNGASGDVTNLTEEQLKLLSPDELTKYLGVLKAANATPPNKSAQEELAKMNGELHAKIKSEDRKPYDDPKDAAAFAKLKDWQKAKFCKPSAADAGNTPAPSKGTDDTHGGKALPDLIATAGRINGQGGISSSSPAWAVTACDDFKKSQAISTGNGNGNGNGSGTGNISGSTPPVPHDVDKDDEAKGKNKWLTEPLIISAVQGSMVGLLIGSLFGPLGLILGPIIGAVVFYGISKLKE